MAIFSNQATLTYNGTTTNSNIAYGEILEVLSVSKTAIGGNYAPGDLVTYAITLKNTGSAPLNGIVVSDNLGGYDLNGATVYPLTYEQGSATLFIDGVLSAPPTVNAGPPLVFSGINLPGGSNAVLIYEARANAFANPGIDGSITNSATISASGLATPVTVSETVTATGAPVLSISKSISPSQVVDNDRISYTFIIQNTGNQAVIATDNASVSDLFSPILSALSVTLDNIPLAEGVDYTYNDTTGLFTTVPGRILVPAASYTQNPVTGEYTVTPGIATLVVTGTV